MTTKLKKVAIFSLILVSALSLPLIAGSDGLAQGAEDVIEGAGQLGNGDASGDVSNLLQTTINILSWVGGVISVIMIIVGGLKISLANGDSGKVSSGKNTIIYALVGLVVAIMAQVIVQFVLKNI